MKQVIRVAAVLFWGPLLALAADPQDQAFPERGDDSAKYQTEVVAEGLDNPCGLAIRPAIEKEAPQEFFFAESGAGRVLRFTANKPQELHEVLHGLATHDIGDKEALRVGPWSLGFVTPTKLAVVGGSRQGSVEQVGVYALSDQDAFTAEDFEYQVEVSVGDGGFAELPGVVVGETFAYVSSGVPDQPGVIYKCALIGNNLYTPRQQLGTKGREGLSWPAGLCLTPTDQSQFLVASFVGGLSKERDSGVAFILPSEGDIALKLLPGLFDVVALAYSDSGQLYAVDLAWSDEKAGGVFRLDDARLQGRSACRAVKIADVTRPTSLVFDASGALYVTSLGTGTNTKSGQIIKITGEF
jgi:hypothetical protein